MHVGPMSLDQLDPGRRSFLQRFAGSVAFGSGAAVQAVAVSGDLYVNHRVGLAFRKPAGWGYEHLRTFADIRDAYEYAVPDEVLVEELRAGPMPMVVVSQRPVALALAASAVVGAEESPLLPDESLVDAADELIRGTSLFVKDFRLIGTPRFGSLGGRPYMDYSFGFLYEDRLGHRGPVRHRTVVVLRRPHLFTFNMLDIPACHIDAQAAFTAIRDSIVLA